MTNKYIIGVFDDEETLLDAVRKVKEKDIDIRDVYTPYPSETLLEILKIKSYFTYYAFLYGFGGALALLAFMYYAAVIDWPMNFGGKPSEAFPSFIIVTIVLTIFLITVLSLFTFSVRTDIYPGRKAIMPDPRSTDDKFVMVVAKDQIRNMEEEYHQMLKDSGASEVYEKEMELKIKP
ncbi:MAG: DUF3341 domain-containing protein [Bacteroidales bacterium]|nr:DUF3341 domain-containing protein [Bacteroidales bacterium]